MRILCDTMVSGAAMDLIRKQPLHNLDGVKAKLMVMVSGKVNGEVRPDPSGNGLTDRGPFFSPESIPLNGIN